MMSYKIIQIIYILLISILIVISSNEINSTLEYCDVQKYCEDCTFCGNGTNNYTLCSYYHLFCFLTYDNIFFQESFLTKYSTFFRDIPKANEFCGKANYNLDSVVDSFSIINKSNKDIKNSNINHCNYEINNTQYFNNYEGTANLIIRFKTNNTKNNNLKLIFNILLRDSRSEKSKQKIINELDLIKEDYELILYNYDSIIILLDFYIDNETNSNIEEYLEIKIDIDNQNIINNSLKKIKITVIFSVFVIFIIKIIIIVYYRHKKKKDVIRTQNEFRQQEKYKNNLKVEKINKLFENKLIPKEFNESDIAYDCTECAICIEKFINKCLIYITPCKHIFHFECLCKFIESTKENEKPIIKCPLCNYDFLEEKNDDKKLNEINNVNSDVNYKNVQQKKFSVRPQVTNENYINTDIISTDNFMNNNTHSE